ncbi:MAG TPA: TrkH family potassium uptake protein [SAR86 cluster bacterium]|nr:TrkH family potassium uptake protein [SAR86 cluster bacterium]
MALPYTTKILGTLLMFFSIAQVLPGFLAYFFDERLFVYNFITTGFITFFIGFLMYFFAGEKKGDLRTKDGFIITVFFWTVLGFFGSIPFFLANLEGVSYIDALFESISGLTTTGATVFVGLDEMPKSLLFYRQFLQWLGGMGIIVLAVAVLPLLGVGGMQLYKAETPGPMKDAKLTPRITETAKALWFVYATMTFICAVLYKIFGMKWFDAVCHAFSTISIGGFSTHDANFAYFEETSLRWIAIFFMIISGVNFALHYIAWTKRRLFHYFYDSEVKLYLSILVTTGLITYITLFTASNLSRNEIFTDSFFQAVSIGTTTGFLTSSYSSWPLFIPVMLLTVAFIGACAGSTGGGIKVIRALVLLRQGFGEITKLIHPNAVVTVKLGRNSLDPRVSESVWGFFSIYVAVFLTMLMFLLSQNNDFITSFSAVGATLNNLGPGLGEVANNYKELNNASKLGLCLTMLLGRLEIFTLLLVFTPAFWRS